MTHEVVWKPPRDGSTNVERFMAAHAIESFDALVARSIQVPENSANATLWDFAGAFTLMGCAAAILGEPDQAAPASDQP